MANAGLAGTVQSESEFSGKRELTERESSIIFYRARKIFIDLTINISTNSFANIS